LDLRPLACIGHGPGLARLVPDRTVRFRQQQGVTGLSGRERLEQRRTLVIEDDMAPLPAFAGPDVDRSAVRVEIRGAERGELAIACAGGKRSLSQAPEIWIAGIEQPLGLSDRQITCAGAISLLEGLNTAPTVIG